MSKGTHYTVDMGSPSTVFKERAVATPSFADVCTGDKVRAAGPVSAGAIVSATQVTVIPPRQQKVSGTVVSVDHLQGPRHRLPLVRHRLSR